MQHLRSTLLLLLIACALGQPVRAWTSFQPNDAGVTLEVPAATTLQESHVGSLIGKVKVQAWTTRSKKCSYRVSLISPPRLAALALSPSRAIDAARDGLIKDTNAQQVSFDERNLGDKPGRELVYTLPGGKFGRAWFVVMGKRCVVLDINGAKRDVDHESPHFFTSLHVN